MGATASGLTYDPAGEFLEVFFVKAVPIGFNIDPTALLPGHHQNTFLSISQPGLDSGWHLHDRLPGLLSTYRFADYGAFGHPKQKILGQGRKMA
jgi:hypothetical protein